MHKNARKPSADPLQEKLRQDKDAWNKEMSVFITNVLHIKKTMNGWPSKYYKQRSRITDPIPADPSSVLTGLADKFQELTQRGNGLVQEQLNYSKNRKKKMPKQPSAPDSLAPTQTPQKEATPPTTAIPSVPKPDLAKQLSMVASRYEDRLVAEGSNPFSRFITRTITPTRGFGTATAIRRLRMDLLRDAIKTYRGLGRVQVAIVSSHKDSSTTAFKEMQRTFNDWLKVSRGFNMFKATQPGGKLSPDVESSPELKSEKPGEQDKLETGQPQEGDEVAPPPPAANPAPITAPQPKTNQIVPFGNKPMQTTAAYQLEATAQAFLKKWVGKTRHQLLPKNTSSYRLQVFNLTAAARKNINEVMNHLEKGLDPNALEIMLQDINKQMTAIKLVIRSIHMSEKPGTNLPMEIF